MAQFLNSPFHFYLVHVLLFIGILFFLIPTPSARQYKHKRWSCLIGIPPWASIMPRWSALIFGYPYSANDPISTWLLLFGFGFQMCGLFLVFVDPEWYLKTIWMPIKNFFLHPQPPSPPGIEKG